MWKVRSISCRDAPDWVIPPTPKTSMKVHFITHGCKANQYDTEQFRMALEARGAEAVDADVADTVVLNTCTVTNAADAEARKAIRKLHRENPEVRVVVAGCSAAMRADEYQAMPEVFGVVPGQDPQEVVRVLADSLHEEAIGQELRASKVRSRGWLKVQDGCDRRCSFCATRIARGKSRSRGLEELLVEAEILADAHSELVITGVHIGHWGIDFSPKDKLSTLMEALVTRVPGVRFRLGSIEATEIDDRLVELMQDGGITPHLHIPMQSGSDPVLRKMRRWHTRERYRVRVKEITERLPYMGLGADIIVGFPGESAEMHAETLALVEELPYTYLHVFPYSMRSGTVAADMDDQVPRTEKSRRSQELRDAVQRKGDAYITRRIGQDVAVVVEEGGLGLSEDYLRVRVPDNHEPGTLIRGTLAGTADELRIVTA